MISARLDGMAHTVSFSAVMDVMIMHATNQMDPVSAEVHGQGLAVIAALMGDMEQNVRFYAVMVVSVNNATTPQGYVSANKAGMETFASMNALRVV